MSKDSLQLVKELEVDYAKPFFATVSTIMGYGIFVFDQVAQVIDKIKNYVPDPDGPMQLSPGEFTSLAAGLSLAGIVGGATYLCSKNSRFKRQAKTWYEDLKSLEDNQFDIPHSEFEGKMVDLRQRVEKMKEKYSGNSDRESLMILMETDRKILYQKVWIEPSKRVPR
ncbi:hypothetical protein KY331_00690 [Candidatus Woesearchaeota archaeon]|nr:hypothetical protein [Candidatus Woesearchaeota archaeon]